MSHLPTGPRDGDPGAGLPPVLMDLADLQMQIRGTAARLLLLRARLRGLDVMRALPVSTPHRSMTDGGTERSGERGTGLLVLLPKVQYLDGVLLFKKDALSLLLFHVQ